MPPLQQRRMEIAPRIIATGSSPSAPLGKMSRVTVLPTNNREEGRLNPSAALRCWPETPQHTLVVGCAYRDSRLRNMNFVGSLTADGQSNNHIGDVINVHFSGKHGQQCEPE